MPRQLAWGKANSGALLSIFRVGISAGTNFSLAENKQRRLARFQEFEKFSFLVSWRLSESAVPSSAAIGIRRPIPRSPEDSSNSHHQTATARWLQGPIQPVLELTLPLSLPRVMFSNR